VESTISTILVAVDGSDSSVKAAGYAFELAKNNNAKVTFVHVVDTTSMLVSLPHETRSRAAALGKYDTREIFDEVRNMAKRKGLDVNTEVIESPVSAAAAIVRYAKKKRFDLVVVGTRGQSKMNRILLGSVASKVVERCPCPVLVVR
jgi:nucleotide-binding universal stress UspA family protein